MFGNLIASCSYDRKVIIWKETSGTWSKLYEYTNHDSSGIDSPINQKFENEDMFPRSGVDLAKT